MQNTYTQPKINKGKVPNSLSKGTTKNEMIAKNIWYISYSFNGKQFKIKGNINRISNYSEKQYAADVLLETIKKQLADGFNPIEPQQYLEKITKQSLTLLEGISIFLSYHSKHQSKSKTISSYKSKLTDLLATIGDVQVSEITTKDLEDFIISKVNDDSYSQLTIKFAKTTFSTFYNVLISLGYDLTNQATTINNKIKSFKETKEKHLPYNPQQVKDLMAYLDANDPYTALFSRFIYYTFLRPNEIRQLQVRDLNLVNNTITVRAITKKVTKNVTNDLIDIPNEFIPSLEKLNLSKANPNDYILGNTSTFVAPTMIGINTPLTRLRKALKHLKLDKQGYGLYSFKHTGNIARWNSGTWEINEIMVANRHSNPQQTLTYLRDINRTTSIKDKAVPSI